MSDRGFSYLEKVKYGNKSKFLQEFYKGNKPNAFWFLIITIIIVKINQHLVFLYIYAFIKINNVHFINFTN